MGKSSTRRAGILSFTMDPLTVLLAVLVGLVLCSFMNTGTSMVEGLNTIGDHEGACRGRTANQDRICGDAQTASDAVDKDTCGGKTDTTGGMCVWTDYNDTYSYSGGLEGLIYNEWMNAGGLMDVSGVPTPTVDNPMDAFKETALLKLRVAGRCDSASGVAECEDIPNTGGINAANGANFLAHIDVESSDDVPGNTKIPKALQPEVQRQVALCESGWDDPDVALDWAVNGGRPIMGYNVSDGLVCRNPFNYPIVYPGSVPRIHKFEDQGCPVPTSELGSVVPDANCEKRASRCAWNPNQNIGESSMDLIYNNTPFSGSGECGLDSCAAQYPGSCAKTNSVNAMKDGGNWLLNNTPGFPQLV